MAWRSLRSHLDWRSVGLLGVAALLFVPVGIDRDGLPLSTYPMYSSARPTDVRLVTAYGLDDVGARSTLDLELIGASDDPLIVAGELRAAIARDDGEAACLAIAERVVGTRRGSVLQTIEIVTERHDVVARTVGEASLLDRTVHMTCPIGDADAS